MMLAGCAGCDELEELSLRSDFDGECSCPFLELFVANFICQALSDDCYIRVHDAGHGETKEPRDAEKLVRFIADELDVIRRYRAGNQRVYPERIAIR